MFPRFLACVVLLVWVGFAAGQAGPTLLTVFPPGAKAGETVEVTVTGSGFDDDEQLLFSVDGITAERVGVVTKVDPKAKQPAPKMAGTQPTNAVKFKVTVKKDGVGRMISDVRVVSKGGLSNPRAFAVSEMTEVNEAEPNNDVPQAQKVELNTAVNGVISTPTDVDYVRFAAKKGENVVVYCLTTTIDSKMQADLAVIGPDGKQLAANRGYRGGDAVLDFLPPTDGEYLVRVSQFAYTTAGPDHFYRLTVTTEPWVDAVYPAVGANPREPQLLMTVHGRNLVGGKPDKEYPRPNGRPLDTAPFVTTPRLPLEKMPVRPHLNRPILPTAAPLDLFERDGHLALENAGPVVLDNEENATPDKAQAVKLPCDIAGRIVRKNDRHWYRFDAKKGEVWTLEVFAERVGSPVDAFFVLTDEKGKVIVEVDDGADTLSPNQFYTKGDDPARYRFAVPADGTYRVMVSTREAATQFGVRDQYVLRIAKEKPDFRLAVMPVGAYYPDAGTLPKGGAALFSVFVFRLDGFDGPIALSAENLPEGVTCPPQVVGPGQTRGTLVFTADKDAEEWAGFVTVRATATIGGETVGHAARPFTVVWPIPGVQPNQVPNTPTITRMDRGPGLALAVRGEAPFALTPATKTPIKVPAGGKVELTLKVERKAGNKDAIQVFAATPNVGPRQQGNQPQQPLATIAAGATEAKVSVDVPANLPGGTYSLVLRGQSAAPPPKGPQGQVRPPATFPSVPVTIEVQGRETPKKK